MPHHAAADPRASHENDAITAAVEIIGDRWSLLVLRGVFRGLHRFAELRDDLGIASNLLTTRLEKLVAEGVLDRIPYQDRPVRHEYRLTDAGRDLSPVLISIMQWGDRHRLGGSSDTTLVHAACGAPVVNTTRCSACDTDVEPHDIRSTDDHLQKPTSPT
ncbi:MAG: winged helix-turn-helix transcriptional regulator [Acidimicrobiales bacterium]